MKSGISRIFVGMLLTATAIAFTPVSGASELDPQESLTSASGIPAQSLERGPGIEIDG